MWWCEMCWILQISQLSVKSGNLVYEREANLLHCGNQQKHFLIEKNLDLELDSNLDDLGGCEPSQTIFSNV